MIVVPYGRFTDEEAEVLIRALQGHEYTLDPVPTKRKGEERHPVRSFLHRIRDEDVLDQRALAELDEVLVALIERWRPETKAAWWREQGAPGGDAIEGLAQERRFAIERASVARQVVALALDTLSRAEHAPYAVRA